MPVLVITGVLDAKFTELGRRMVDAIGANAGIVVVPDCGHAPQLQRPHRGGRAGAGTTSVAAEGADPLATVTVRATTTDDRQQDPVGQLQSGRPHQDGEHRPFAGPRTVRTGGTARGTASSGRNGAIMVPAGTGSPTRTP